VYVIIWKNIIEPARPQMTVVFMRVACWIHKVARRKRWAGHVEGMREERCIRSFDELI
jgi:hypothetical protein